MAGEHKFWDWANRAQLHVDGKFGYIPVKQIYLVGWGAETSRPADVCVYINVDTRTVYTSG